MNKNTLKSIIELQAEKIEELKEALENSHKEHVKAVNLMDQYHKDATRFGQESFEWKKEAERLNEILDKKDQEYQHLKRNYNAFKEKNDNLLIANGKLIKANKELEGLVKEKNESIMISNEAFQKELKEVETCYEKKIDGMSKSYGEEIENLLKQMRDKS